MCVCMATFEAILDRILRQAINAPKRRFTLDRKQGVCTLSLLSSLFSDSRMFQGCSFCKYVYNGTRTGTLERGILWSYVGLLMLTRNIAGAGASISNVYYICVLMMVLQMTF